MNGRAAVTSGNSSSYREETMRLVEEPSSVHIPPSIELNDSLKASRARSLEPS